jgi:hypothetical protein
MKQNASRKSKTSPTNQGISAFYEMHRYIQSRLLTLFLMYILILHSYLQMVLAIGSFLLFSPSKPSTHFSSLSYVPHSCLVRFDHLKNIWRGIQIRKLIVGANSNNKTAVLYF